MSTLPLVKIKNELVRAAHGLTLMEKRLLMLAISKLDSDKPATPENMTVEIYVSEFIEQYGITAKSTYGDVREAAEHLMDRYIRFFSENGKKETRMQWVGQATYEENKGLVILDFWHKLAPMLFELKREFTSYKLSRAGALRSIYSWRLFELLMQFKKTGFLSISLEEFWKVMDVPQSMRNKFVNLRARVIDPAIKEITEKDGLPVSWKIIKTGRKVTGLEFRFPIEQEASLPFSADLEEHPKAYTRADLDKNPSLAKPGESYEQALYRLNHH